MSARFHLSRSRAASTFADRPASSSGVALPAAVRTALEPRFGHDFSRVRVHREGDAGAVALPHGSPAGALGSHITLASSALAGDPARFRRLISHELAHVVQSGRGGAPSGKAALEQEAHAAGERAAAGRDARVALAGPPGQVLHAPPDLALPPPRVGWTPPELTSSWYTLENFDTNHADLKPAHISIIDQVIKDLASDPLRGGFITVIGHADAVGNEPENKILGQQRADAVRGALIAKGVSPDDVRAGSIGESVLAVDTQQAEAKNRRVQIVVRRRSLSLGTTARRGAQGGGPVGQISSPGQGIAGRGTGPVITSGRGDDRQRDFEQRIRDLAVQKGADKDTAFDAAVDYLARNGGPPLANEIANIAGALGIDRKWAKEQVENGLKQGIEAGLKAALKAIVEAIAGPPSGKPPFEAGPPVFEQPRPSILSVPLPIPGDKPAPTNTTTATVTVTNRLSSVLTKTVFKPGEFISFNFTTPTSFGQVRAVAEIVPAGGGTAVRTIEITGRRSGSESLAVPDSAGQFVLQVTLVGEEPGSRATFHFSVAK
jgi:outer membrane protein OmpA-like peptidoglycan-associated protein